MKGFFVGIMVLLFALLLIIWDDQDYRLSSQIHGSDFRLEDARR